MAGSLTISTLKDSSGVLATQNGMTGIAKAWVQFAGATATIAGSFNVSSVTRASTGDYTINFTTAMANANYALVACCDTYLASNAPTVVNTFNGGTYTTSAVRIITTYASSTNYQDTPRIGVAILSS
jgi:hypothetical protein